MKKFDRRSFLTMAGALAAAPVLNSAKAQTVAAPASKTGGLAYRSVSELRAMLDARKVSAGELLDQAIARIEMHDTKINAVVVRDFDRARAAAAAADAALARGEQRRAAGNPDDGEGVLQHCGIADDLGFSAWARLESAEDAVAVTRLKQAGAVILGKTNLATAIGDWQSYNVIYGVTNNPWDVARTAGGSSGGSAAALAAGYVPLELGSDISSSLRMPAHVCGVFSHKPSSDLVPQRGHAPPRSPALQTDLTNGLGVAVQWREALPIWRWRSTCWRVRMRPGRRLPPVAAAGAAFGVAKFSRARDRRSSAAAGGERHTRCAGPTRRPPRPRPVRPWRDRASSFPISPKSAKLHTRMIRNFAAFGAPPEVFQKARENVATLARDDDSIRAQFMRAPLMSHHDWLVAEIGRARLRAQWRALFAEFDVVLCPPFAVPAFPHDHSEPRDNRTIDIDGKPHPYISLIVWGTLATPPGLPATVAPIGRSPSGLPIGVQIIGPLLEDRTTIAFAGLLEREFGGFVAPPGMGG